MCEMYLQVLLLCCQPRGRCSYSTMPCHACRDCDGASPLLLTWTPDNELVNKDASSAAPLDVTLQSPVSHNGVDSAPFPGPAGRAAASVRLQVLRPCTR